MARLGDVTNPVYGDGYVRGLEDGRLTGLREAFEAVRKLRFRARPTGRRRRAIEDCANAILALMEEPRG